MLTAEQTQRLAVAAAEARKCEIATGVPAEMIVAQWAIESGWGSKSPGNNCFGIKQFQGAAGRQLLTTTEWFTDGEAARFLAGDDERTADLAQPVQTAASGRRKYRVQDWFASFATLSDCFARRAALFTKGLYAPFAAAYKQNHDFPALVRGIGPKYATDPNYATQVLAVANMPQVKAAIAAARAAG